MKKIALVGCGRILARHLEAIAANPEIQNLTTLFQRTLVCTRTVRRGLLAKMARQLSRIALGPVSLWPVGWMQTISSSSAQTFTQSTSRQAEPRAERSRRQWKDPGRQ